MSGMFKIEKIKKGRRKGCVRLKNGELKTPFFMPDATRAYVKFLSKEDLEKIGIVPMVVNTYHLFLNPGLVRIKKSGGVHRFMNWTRPLLSDSGGYQVFSLIHKNPKMGKITEEEVIFHSPVDGRKNVLTPEKAIGIQFDLGVDMMVCLDDPPPNNYPKEKIEAAVERTVRWAKRCKAEYLKQLKKRKIPSKMRPLIFGVVQGGEHLDLRERCARELVKIGFDGYGFGARHVDSEGRFLERVMRSTASYIPEESLRFALGVGTPEDIVRCHAYGWDMFDCVIPTREGRHGRIFIKKRNFASLLKKFEKNGKGFCETININNGKFKDSFSPVDKKCDCELCRNHTRAYLHHLFSSKDPLGMRLASIHNLKFYMDLMSELGKTD